MKLTTNEWLLAAEDDLIAAKKLVDEARLTNVVAFHCLIRSPNKQVYHSITFQLPDT